ncbi:acyl carrier protein [Skermania sp. ID1734]|uniref:acyl carrier protein n=1 Tax=Skermania sp. ID1734 TaxID=2597516 RepID=UPI00117D3F7A|nr:acyl carrier protein [Skermania sp. ID1734]TSE00395.1 acyl carrier protein [Skermania sp. ID1734]
MTTPQIVDLHAVEACLDSCAQLSAPAATIDRTADLYDLGLSSHASVNVMMAIEEALDLHFPDSLLRKSTFASIEAILDAIATIRTRAATDGVMQ